MQADEQRVLDDIARHGCHVISVFDPADAQPHFSYSVGIEQTLRQPELIVVGLKSALGHRLVNACHQRLRDGERFLSDTLYDDFLEGFPVCFLPVSDEHRRDWLRYDVWLYAGQPFRALQMIYPSTRGAWPWDATASDWFRANQPLLGPCPRLP